MPVLGPDSLPVLVPTFRECNCGADKCIKLAARRYRLNPSAEAAKMLLEYRQELAARATERENGLPRNECLNKLAYAGVPVITLCALRDLEWEDRASLVAAKAFMRQRSSHLLFLTGSPGVGKTFAGAWCLLEYARTFPWNEKFPTDSNPREPIAYAVASEIGSLSSFAPHDKEHFDRLMRARLVFVDELGREAPTTWGRDRLSELMSRRIDNKRPTIVSTNLATSEMKLYGEHLADRLQSHAMRPELETVSRRSGKEWRKAGRPS
jgi:DNA replication protein DnaC